MTESTRRMVEMLDEIEKLDPDHKFLQNLRNRNIIVSAAHHIRKTASIFDAFLEADRPESPGGGWLRVFGVLQALIVQQDAIRHLLDVLDISVEPEREWEPIRELRRGAVGHPVERNDRIRSHLTTTDDFSFRSLVLHTDYSDGRPETRTFVDLSILIQDQIAMTGRALDIVLEKIRRTQDDFRVTADEGDPG
jgi:hypothetical protein